MVLRLEKHLEKDGGVSKFPKKFDCSDDESPDTKTAPRCLATPEPEPVCQESDGDGDETVVPLLSPPGGASVSVMADTNKKPAGLNDEYESNIEEDDDDHEKAFDSPPDDAEGSHKGFHNDHPDSSDDEYGDEEETAVGANDDDDDDDYNDNFDDDDEDIEVEEEEDLDEDALIPDGGWGWTVCLGSFMVNFILDGTMFSFGILLLDLLEDIGSDKATTSWAGGSLVGFSMFAGPLVSYLLKTYSVRQVTIAGAVVTMLGFMMSSFSVNIYMFIFTYGVIGGTGICMSFLPAIIVVGLYFNKKRAMATGIATSGSGLGTFAYAYIANSLLESYKWRGTVLILGGLVLNVAVCGMVFRPITPRRMAQTASKKTKSKQALSRQTTKMEQPTKDDGSATSGYSSDKAPSPCVNKHDGISSVLLPLPPVVVVCDDGGGDGGGGDACGGGGGGGGCGGGGGGRSLDNVDCHGHNLSAIPSSSPLSESCSTSRDSMMTSSLSHDSHLPPPPPHHPHPHSHPHPRSTLSNKDNTTSGSSLFKDAILNRHAEVHGSSRGEKNLSTSSLEDHVVGKCSDSSNGYNNNNNEFPENVSGDIPPSSSISVVDMDSGQLVYHHVVQDTRRSKSDNHHNNHNNNNDTSDFCQIRPCPTTIISPHHPSPYPPPSTTPTPHNDTARLYQSAGHLHFPSKYNPTTTPSIPSSSHPTKTSHEVLLGESKKYPFSNTRLLNSEYKLNDYQPNTNNAHHYHHPHHHHLCVSPIHKTPKNHSRSSGHLKSYTHGSGHDLKPHDLEDQGHMTASRSAYFQHQISKGLMRPILRQDIYYGGSVNHISASRQFGSVASFVAAMTRASSTETCDVVHQDEKGAESTRGRGLASTCFPSSAFLFQNRTFVLLLITFTMWTAQSVSLTYIPDLAVSRGISRPDAAFLISIVGIANVLARLLAGLVTDILRVPASWLYIGALTTAAIINVVIAFGYSYLLLCLCSAVFGLCMGVAVSMRTIVLAEELGIQYLTQSFGIVAMFQGVAFTLNPPIAGKLIDSFDSFEPPFLMVSAMYGLSAISVVAVVVLNYFKPITTFTTTTTTHIYHHHHEDDDVTTNYNSSVLLGDDVSILVEVKPQGRCHGDYHHAEPEYL